jgi:hypothetical protein
LSAANQGSQSDKEIEMKNTKKIVLAVAAIAMFVPSFQPKAKADTTSTVVAVANAISVYLFFPPPAPPPPPPPPPPRIFYW